LWFGKDVTGNFHEQFEVLGGFDDDVMNEF
jgi:hypothetical protein